MVEDDLLSDIPTRTVSSYESSRLIVKNLPKRITAERIRGHFGAKGTVTDVRLAMTPDGRSRGFAFIGFSAAQEARDAAKYFDKTFMDTSRIQVELAKPRGDPTLERPWSKYSLGSSGYDARNAVPETKSAGQEAAEKKRLQSEMEKKKKFLMSIYGKEVDPELERFVSAMKSKGKTKTWENDDEAFAGPAKAAAPKAGKGKTKPGAKVHIDVSAVPSRKAGANGALVEQVHLKFDQSSEDEEEDAQDYHKAFGGSESDDELYDEVLVEGDGVAEEVEDSARGENVPAEEDGERLPASVETESTSRSRDSVVESDDLQPALTPELIAENGRLFVRNLSYACAEDDLRTLFEPFGPLTEVHVPISRETKRPKGFAYILFMLPEHALKAYSALDGTIFQGRLLHVLPSHDKPVKEAASTAQGKQSAFKTKQEQERKAQSDKDYNWNSLFIRPDTILDAVAAHLGVAKAQIMDSRSADNLATRLAVAETHLVQETKAYLEGQGVQLDAFSGRPASRSTTLLLAKNLSFETEAAELRRLFGKFGSLGRVVLPPSTKAIALIEFLEAAEARAAFKALAYSRFHDVPLYLEWAPVAALRPQDRKDADAGGPEEEVVRVRTITAADVKDQAVGDGEGTVGAPTLYVANINWSTPADTLKQIFSAAGPVQSVRLATKKDAKSGQTLSLGFGFIEFARREALNRALDTLQGTVVDGHALLLKRSTGGSQPAASAKPRKSASAPGEVSHTAVKLLVRNVPFEATDKDLKELFRAFAQLKRVRLPRRFNGQHRGFAFAEFLTHAEAANALATLAHTHLYGRHLVIEWAKEADTEDDEGVGEEARRKAAKRSAASAAGAEPARRRTKSSRVTLDGEDDPEGGSIPLEDD